MAFRSWRDTGSRNDPLRLASDLFETLLHSNPRGSDHRYRIEKFYDRRHRDESSSRSTSPIPAVSLSLYERKRLILVDRVPDAMDWMRKWLDRQEVYLRKDSVYTYANCWIHSNLGSHRSRRSINVQVPFKHQSKLHRVSLPYGVIAMLMKGVISEDMVQGLLQKQSWHLSHLCGNWTCCNWIHMTIEPSRINHERNACLNDQTAGRYDVPCSHEPMCRSWDRRISAELMPT